MRKRLLLPLLGLFAFCLFFASLSGGVAFAAGRDVDIADVTEINIAFSAVDEAGRRLEPEPQGTEEIRTVTYGATVTLSVWLDDGDGTTPEDYYEEVFITYQWLFKKSGSADYVALAPLNTTTNVDLTLTDCNQSGSYRVRATEIRYSNSQRSFNGGEIFSEPVAVVISPKELSVRYTVTEKVYNGAAQQADFTVLGEVAGKPASCQLDYLAADVGDYPVSVFTRNENYVVQENSAVFSITKAPLTVTVGDVVVLAGYSYQFPITYQGFKESDNEEKLEYVPYIRPEDLVTTREPGYYEIYPDGPKTDKNYEITYVPGTLQVNRSSLAGASIVGFEGKATGSFSSDAKLKIVRESLDKIKDVWCSARVESQIQNSKTTIKYCDCNAFGVLASTGDVDALYAHPSERMDASLVAYFNALATLYTDFIGNYAVSESSLNEWKPSSGSKPYEAYSRFFDKVKETFDHSQNDVTKNLSYNLAGGAVVGLNKTFSVTFDSTANTGYNSLFRYVSRLFGFNDADLFRETVTALAAAYAANPAEANVESVAGRLKYSGAVLTNGGVFVLPYAFRNDLASTVLAVVFLDTSGIMSVWISDVNAAAKASNFHAETTSEKVPEVDVYGRCTLFETTEDTFHFWQVPVRAYELTFTGKSNRETYTVVMENVTLPGVFRSICFVNSEGKTETIPSYTYDKNKKTLTFVTSQTSGHIVVYHNYLWYAVPAVLLLLIVISLLIFHHRDRKKHKLNRLISGSAKVEAEYYRQKIGEYEENERRKL